MLSALTAGELLTYWGRWARGGGPKGYRSALTERGGRMMPLSADDLRRIEAALAQIAPANSPERALLLTYYAAPGRPSIRRTAERLASQYGLHWSPATVARRLADCRQSLDRALSPDLQD